MIYTRPRIRLTKPSDMDLSASYIRQARRFGQSDKQIAESLSRLRRIHITEKDVEGARKEMGVK